jgi:hypothetical protein
MQFALFLPDSEISSVTSQGNTLVIRLAAASVERASPQPGLAPETGYSQGISLWLHEAAVEADASPLIGRISQSALQVGDAALSRLPVPFETSAPVRLELQLAHRSHCVASGRGMSVRFDGEANFKESFAC